MLQITKLFRTVPMMFLLVFSLTITLFGLLISLPTTLARGSVLRNLKIVFGSFYLQYLDANDYVSTGKYGTRLMTAFKQNKK